MRSNQRSLTQLALLAVTLSAVGCAHLEKLGFSFPTSSSPARSRNSSQSTSSPSLLSGPTSTGQDGALGQGAGMPAWCGSWDRSNSSSIVDQEGFTEGNLNAASTEPCAHHGETAFVNQSSRFLEKWRVGSGLTQKEITNSMTLRANQGAWRAALATACKPLQTLAETDKTNRPKRGTQSERARAAALARILDCKETGRPVFDPLDVDGDSQLIRVAVVARCYGLWNHLHDESSTLVLSEEAGCAADATLLDRAKFEAELTSLGGSAVVATRAREFFARTWTMSRWTLAHLKEDPDAWEVAVKAPLAARASYAESAARNKAALDAAMKWEDSRVAKTPMTGCDTELGAAFARLSQKMPATSEERTAELYEKEPVAWRVMKALVGCHTALGQQNLADSLETTWLVRARDLPGPRAAMTFALFDAKVAKDLDFTPGRNVWSAMDDRRSFGFANAASVVASVKPARGGVRVDFTSDFIDLSIMSCTETNKIDRITADGKIEYRQNCKVVGTEKRRVQEDSIVIPTAFATGVQPGRYMSFHRFSDKTSGAPRGVYAGKKPEKLVAVAGFAVKP